jgi:hypothetical protein
MPATLAQKAAQTMKSDSHTLINSSTASLPLSSSGKSGSLTTVSSTSTISASTPTPTSSTSKRTSSKTSVFAKIFK